MQPCSDRATLVTQVAEQLRSTIADALTRRGTASLVLAGGGTPMPIYAELAQAELDWASVLALPGDERWVAGDNEASNHFQMTQQFGPAAIRLERLVPEHPGRKPDPAHARQLLSSIPSPFDLVLLGMGGDGHFASLFPGSPALAAGLDPDCEEQALIVTPDPLPPEAPYSRITLTLSKLLSTRRLLLVITGEHKREVLAQAAGPNADPNQLPVAALLQAAGDRLEVFWSP